MPCASVKERNTVATAGPQISARSSSSGTTTISVITTRSRFVSVLTDRRRRRLGGAAGVAVPALMNALPASRRPRSVGEDRLRLRFQLAAHRTVAGRVVQEAVQPVLHDRVREVRTGVAIEELRDVLGVLDDVDRRL